MIEYHDNEFFMSPAGMICVQSKLRRSAMAGSVYKIIELVGTSTVSWEEAAKTAIEMAGQSLKDLRIAEITKLDMQIDEGNVVSYRARVSVSFKYQR
jgi:flavin-binding protein dodecin